jgi:hypothetical protein
MATYRDPDTGRFITYTEWERLQEDRVDEWEDWEDLENWDSFDEDEIY